MSVHCQHHSGKLKCSWCWITSSYESSYYVNILAR